MYLIFTCSLRDLCQFWGIWISDQRETQIFKIFSNTNISMKYNMKIDCFNDDIQKFKLQID